MDRSTGSLSNANGEKQVSFLCE